MPETTKVSSIRAPNHDYLNEWLCEGAWQIKNIKSDLSQHLLSPNLSE